MYFKISAKCTYKSAPNLITICYMNNLTDVLRDITLTSNMPRL